MLCLCEWYLFLVVEVVAIALFYSTIAVAGLMRWYGVRRMDRFVAPVFIVVVMAAELCGKLVFMAKVDESKLEKNSSNS